jgi:dienelactone hydrolase
MVARIGLAATLLLAACGAQPAAQSTPRASASLPPGVSSEAGVAVQGGAVVHDISYTSGGSAVRAFLVLPKQPPKAGVLFFHWLSSEGGNRTEFKAEAVALAGHGIASLLIQGDFPWSTQPSGADHDIQAIRSQVAGAQAGVDLLLKQPGVDVHHLAFVGHDYGAMHGAVLLAQDSRFSAAVLMAPDAQWVNWFTD